MRRTEYDDDEPIRYGGTGHAGMLCEWSKEFMATAEYADIVAKQTLKGPLGFAIPRKETPDDKPRSSQKPVRKTGHHNRGNGTRKAPRPRPPARK